VKAAKLTFLTIIGTMTAANLIFLSIIGILLLSTSANVVSKVDANGNSVRVLCQERTDHRSR